MIHKSRILSTFDNLSHGFFSAYDNGGESLNAAFSSNENEVEVKARRSQMIYTMTGSQPTPLITLNQVHGNKVITIDKDWESTKLHPADGLVTNLPGLALGILTADCAPILFYDPESRVIGACHAGWRGAVLGIIENTIDAMQDMGANKSSTIAVLGPTIQQENYEVGPEFPLKVLRGSHMFSDFFKKSPKNSGHFLFDLPQYIKNLILEYGINTIENSSIDTYSKDFFSRRFSIDNGNQPAGRCNLSAITINQ